MSRLKHNPDYERLKVGGRGAFGRTSYWLGADHLLVVEIPGYVEKYRRFRFADIQAVVVQSSRRRLWWNLGVSIPLVITGLGLFAGLLDRAGATSWSDRELIGLSILLGLTVAFGAIVLVNSLRGPGATVHLRTAVQTLRLPGVTRRLRAQRLVDALRPRVEAVQGGFSTEELGVQLAAEPASPPISAPEPDAPPAPPLPLPRLPYASRAHIIMSWIALVDVVGTPVSLWISDAWSTFYTGLHIPALLIATIVAMVKQSRTSLSGWLRRLPLFILIELGVCIATALIIAAVYAVRNPEMLRDETLLGHDNPLELTMTIVSTLTNGALGLWGVLLWRKFKQSTAAGPAA